MMENPPQIRRDVESVLLDRRYFTLDAASFFEFKEAMEKPPADLSRLRRTLAAKAPWEA